MNSLSDEEKSLEYVEISALAVQECNSTKVAQGKTFPPQQQILLYSADEWEEFIEEWTHHQKTNYEKVVRLSGSKDMGIDVAGFTDGQGFQGVWDNYQCKHYNKPLTPSTAILEIGKILWHSFKGSYVAPRKHYFIAPKNCGMSLKKLLLKSDDLQSMVREKWNKLCAQAITSTETITIESEFLTYFEDFDFSIFTFKTALEIIEEHRQTPYYTTRFGGGLPDRPKSDIPPEAPDSSESRYIQQLFAAYSDHKSIEISDIHGLKPWPDLEGHHNRQREHFYHAESLRNFARDTVPEGTFDELKEEVYAGVADVECETHADGFARMNAVTSAATTLHITANSLISVVKVQDKKGICHQLANEERLRWRKE